MDQGPAHDLARVHLGAIDRALEQLLERQRAMAGVQEQSGEDFVSASAQALGEIAAGRGGVGQRFAAFQRGSEMAMAQFQRRRQFAGPGRTQAGQFRHLGRVVFQQGAQRAMGGEQFAGSLHRIPPAQARTQEDRQQFGVRQRAGAAGQQLFTGSFFHGPVAYVHRTSLPWLMPAGHKARHMHRVS